MITGRNEDHIYKRKSYSELKLNDMVQFTEMYGHGPCNEAQEVRIKELEDALHKTFIKLIQVCPSSLVGDKELIDVFDIAEKALRIEVNASKLISR